ncbi:MAG: sel1 repeat family protein [Alphaproteobacteria bacterium]|nr:MAG: sel1 repeat family protein [Alphaproteobacteria bacterium]
MSHMVLMILAAALWLVGGLAVVAFSLKRRKLPMSLAFKLSSEREHMKNFVWYEWIMFTAIAGASLMLFWNAIAEDTGAVGANGCPMDTHICGDGTYVSRSGPHCAFMPCSNSAAGGLVALYNQKDEPDQLPPKAQPAPGGDASKGPQDIKAADGGDTEPDIEAEPVIDANTPKEIDVENCAKGDRAGYMQNGHPVTFAVSTTKSNLCLIKVVRDTEEGGEAYNCEFRTKGLPEQGFIKYFKVETFDSIRDRACSRDYSEVLNLYRRAAARGNPNAQYNMAKYYDQRHGITEDFPEAAKWYRKAADQGHVGAEYNLGLFYNQGLGVTQNFAEAAKWYRKAAEQGLAEAQYSLGLLYDRGLGVKQDYKEASEWYRKGAAQGNADAQAALGDLYATGHGVQQAYEVAYFWYIVAAASNNKDYITKRDQIIRFVPPGKTMEVQKRGAAWRPTKSAATTSLLPKVTETPPPAPPPPPAPKPPPPPAPPPPPPPAPAPVVAPVPPAPAPPPPPKPLPTDLPSLEALANEGDAAAQFALASYYSKGNPITDDNDRAAKWYLKAAEQGNAKAAYAIGLFYEQGRGVKQDVAEAAKWYRKAADQGVAGAQYMLGLLYLNGKGIKQDDAEALKYLSEAAEMGIPDAQYRTGMLYMAGKGVEQNYLEAFDFFKRAAEQGDDNAQYSLATMLMQGAGEDIPKNMPEAFFWLLLSSTSQNKMENIKRISLRDKVEKKIDPHVAYDLRKRAQTWKPTREVVR